MNERSTPERRLYVAWQNRETRAIKAVGVLSRLGEAEGFTFGYLKAAENLEGFRPFSAFPYLHTRYASDSLFSFFQNRVMDAARPEYAHFVESLDLQAGAEPFDILERSGGGRATDPIEVFPEPCPDPSTGKAVCVFFARGIRYVDGAPEAVDKLQVGQQLALMADIQNSSNSLALVLRNQTYQPFGFLPDYLLEHAHSMLKQCGEAQVVITVERVNSPDVPPGRRLLCRMETCWPTGYQPFSGPDFVPLASAESQVQ